MANLRLSGIVGEGITANGITAFLNQNDDNDITIFLNSPGGYITEGLEIYNLLRSSGRNITTVLTGMAASMASIIFLAGDKRIALTGTLFMVHKPSGAVYGNADEMQKEIELLDKMQDSAASIYQERTGIEDFNEYMNRVTWFDTEEMKQLGITNAEGNVLFELENTNNDEPLDLESEENMSIEELKAEKAKMEAENAELQERLEEARLEKELAEMKAKKAKMEAEVTALTESSDEEEEKETTETDEVEETETETEIVEKDEEEEIEEPTMIDTRKTVAKKSNSKIPAWMQVESKY